MRKRNLFDMLLDTLSEVSVETERDMLIRDNERLRADKDALRRVIFSGSSLSRKERLKDKILELKIEIAKLPNTACYYSSRDNYKYESLKKQLRIYEDEEESCE